MFKNREFVIRINKANEGNEDEPLIDEKLFEERAAVTHTVIKDLIKTVVIGLCTYVVFDTGRQVLIAKSTDIRVYD